MNWAYWGKNWVSEVVPQGIREFSLTAEDFGLPEVDPREVVVANAEESARMIRQVLTGMEGPARYLVLANAAAALVIAGQCGSLAEGVMLAAAAIDSGRAERLLRWMDRVFAGDFGRRGSADGRPEYRADDSCESLPSYCLVPYRFLLKTGMKGRIIPSAPSW